MNLEDIQTICNKLPGMKSDIKWEDHLCFNVGDKMFLITSPGSTPVNASFKAGDEEFEELSSREGFMPAPYLARYKWVHVDDIRRLSRKEWEHIINRSYSLISSKLPLKKRKLIDTLKTKSKK